MACIFMQQEGLFMSLRLHPFCPQLYLPVRLTLCRAHVPAPAPRCHAALQPSAGIFLAKVFFALAESELQLYCCWQEKADFHVVGVSSWLLLPALPLKPAEPLSLDFPLSVPLHIPAYGCGSMLVWSSTYVCVCMCALTLLYCLHADIHLLGVDGNGREPQLLTKEKVETSRNAVLRQA